MTYEKQRKMKPKEEKEWDRIHRLKKRRKGRNKKRKLK